MPPIKSILKNKSTEDQPIDKLFYDIEKKASFDDTILEQEYSPKDPPTRIEHIPQMEHSSIVQPKDIHYPQEVPYEETSYKSNGPNWMNITIRSMVVFALVFITNQPFVTRFIQNIIPYNLKPSPLRLFNGSALIAFIKSLIIFLLHFTILTALYYI